MPRRRLMLGALLFGTPALAAAATALLARFRLTGDGGTAAALVAIALLAAVPTAERLAADAPGGPLHRLRGRALPWLMLALVANGAVRTWTLAVDLPMGAAAVALTNTLATVFAAALAALLIGPTLERLAAALREGPGDAATLVRAADARAAERRPRR